jgi:hypothetical protein
MASTKPTSDRCPICGRTADAHYHPFCSRRCADVDLSRWLSGTYAIPGAEDADEDGEQASPADYASDKDDPDRAN